MSTVSEKHPLYTVFHQDWKKMRDTYRGGRVVKEAGKLYLPPTGGHIQDGFPTPESVGSKEYAAYKERAVFHEFVSDAVEAALGVMHLKPPVIELPDQMEFMREKATQSGESLEQLLRRINEQQLVAGRLGLLLDLPTEERQKVEPYIATYHAEAVINWDDSLGTDLRLGNLNLVVLDESGYRRKNIFEWEWLERYRVLMLGDPVADELAGTAAYTYGVFENTSAGTAGAKGSTTKGAKATNSLTFNQAVMKAPSVSGQAPSRIPFVFINSKDIIPNPDDPPLLGLAELALSAYRAEADYRQNLFMQGQDTLVVIGLVSEDEGEAIRTGAGARIDLPQGGDAKFIGVGPDGLTEQREAIDNLKGEAGQKGGQLLDSVSRQKESGDALKIRVSARTATLKTIALAGAAGLQEILRNAAEWIGADPTKVTVTPNLDFAEDELQSKSLVEYMTAKTMGAPISNKTIHGIMAKKGVTDLTYEEEVAEIDAEEPLTPPADTTNRGAAGNDQGTGVDNGNGGGGNG